MNTSEINNNEISNNEQQFDSNEQIAASPDEVKFVQASGIDSTQEQIDTTGINDEEEIQTPYDTDDEFAKVIMKSGTRKTPTQANKISQSVDAKLEAACKSKNAFHAVCDKIDKKVQKEYQNKVSCNADLLQQNQEIVEKEFGTHNDQPNGEWIIDDDNADAKDLSWEIERLKIKLQKIQNENNSLETKKANLQNEFQAALAENEKLEAELENED